MLSILSDLFREVIEAEPIGDRKGEEADHAKCRPDNTEHFAFPALRIGKGSLLELERHLPVSLMLGWDEETSFSVRKRDVLAAPRCLLTRWRQCGTKGTVRQRLLLGDVPLRRWLRCHDKSRLRPDNALAEQSKERKEKNPLVLANEPTVSLLPEAQFKDFQPPKPFIAESPGQHAEWIAPISSPPAPQNRLIVFIRDYCSFAFIIGYAREICNPQSTVRLALS